MKKGISGRDFIYVSNKLPKTDFLSFTICSYNILAQYQLQNNLYLYKHCVKEILKWPFRWSNIRNDLQRFNCDIYCLQEVQRDHYYSDIEPSMANLGYTGFLSCKTGEKLDGCAMFVKNSVFDCALSTFETVGFRHNDLKVLSTDNVGQVALLCPTGRPDSKICIANTHLFFNPNRGEVKLAELSLMLSKIDSVSGRKCTTDRDSDSFYWPIVFCGDLNLEPTSFIHRFLVEGHCDINGAVAADVSGQNQSSFRGGRSGTLLSGSTLPPRVGIRDDMAIGGAARGVSLGSGFLSHRLRLRSACEYRSRGNARLVSAFTSLGACAVDHVLYRSTDEPALQLTAYLELLTREQLVSVGGIPNQHHGSDHIPLVAAFNLRL